MKFRKKLVVLLTFTLCIGMYSVAFAETNGNGESVVLPSQIEAHRKDISYTEALNDIAFTQQTNINSAKDNLNTRAVTWEVWGEKELDTNYHMLYHNILIAGGFYGVTASFSQLFNQDINKYLHLNLGVGFMLLAFASVFILLKYRKINY